MTNAARRARYAANKVAINAARRRRYHANKATHAPKIRAAGARQRAKNRGRLNEQARARYHMKMAGLTEAERAERNARGRVNSERYRRRLQVQEREMAARAEVQERRRSDEIYRELRDLAGCDSWQGRSVGADENVWLGN